MNRRTLLLAATGALAASVAPSLPLPQNVGAVENYKPERLELGVSLCDQPDQVWICEWSPTEERWKVVAVAGGALNSFPKVPFDLTYVQDMGWDSEKQEWTFTERPVGYQELQDQLAHYQGTIPAKL